MATRVTGAATAALTTALVTTGLALATLWLSILDWNSPPAYGLAGLSLQASLGIKLLVQTLGLITLSGVSAVILWRRPWSRLSWALIATSLVVAWGTFAGEFALRGLVVEPGSLPLADVAAWTQTLLPDLVFFGAISIILFFPDGRLMSRRWGLLLGAALVVFTAHMLASLDDPYPVEVGLTSTQPVPVTVPPVLWPAGSTLSWASGALIWAEAALEIIAGAAILIRLARVRGDARQQLKWFAYAAALYCVTAVLVFANRLPVPDGFPLADFTKSDVAYAISAWSGIAAVFVGMVVAPAAIAVAMFRYRLYDIDVVINRTIIYGGLALFVTGGYAIVVGGVGGLLGQRAGLNPVLSVLTIALLAILLLPVRSRLHDLADLAVYGKRARPYDVLSDFAESIGHAESAQILLPRMAELLRQGTGATGTEVWARVGDTLQLAAASPVMEAPAPVVEAEQITARYAGTASVEPVFHDGQMLGALVVVKPRGEELNAVERRLFRDVASQAGLVLARFRLVQELRESRARIVASQDVERHRIERNLHDGAQQHFVNALLSLGMAQAEGVHDRGGRDFLLEASREVRSGLNELRSLARGLQPPLLNESGVVAASTALADAAPIATTVVDGIKARRYPQGIETAAYFVISEALTNAAKHSRARKVTVTINEVAGRLCVEVRDDGAGGAEMGGSGIIGLQDRVAAVGGRLFVESPKGGGTVVRAELPCM